MIHTRLFVTTLLLAVLLTSCTKSGRQIFSSDITPGVTDKPAVGFEKIRVGSEEDLIMTVGRRVYFRKGSAAFDDIARETMDIQIKLAKSPPTMENQSARACR